MRHGALGGVDQQQGAVGHLENAFHFAAEIGVARRIDDVDLDVANLQGDVLGQNGDAALAFQIVGIENAIAAQLALPEQAGLAHQLIDKRSFSVIDVGDDRHVANVSPFCQ